MALSVQSRTTSNDGRLMVALCPCIEDAVNRSIIDVTWTRGLMLQMRSGEALCLFSTSNARRDRSTQDRRLTFASRSLHSLPSPCQL